MAKMEALLAYRDQMASVFQTERGSLYFITNDGACWRIQYDPATQAFVPHIVTQRVVYLDTADPVVKRFLQANRAIADRAEIDKEIGRLEQSIGIEPAEQASDTGADFSTTSLTNETINVPIPCAETPRPGLTPFEFGRAGHKFLVDSEVRGGNIIFKGTMEPDGTLVPIIGSFHPGHKITRVFEKRSKANTE